MKKNVAEEMFCTALKLRYQADRLVEAAMVSGESLLEKFAEADEMYGRAQNIFDTLHLTGNMV